MDVILIILITSIVIVGLIFKDFKSEVYFICTMDIIFRLLKKFTQLIKIKPINSFVAKYIPRSIEGLIEYYTDGIVSTIII